MNRLSAALLLVVAGCSAAAPPALQTAPPPTGWSSFSVALPPHPAAAALCPASPFGINTALRPDAPDAEARLIAMENA
ncbi:MAG: hypothetical protein HY293_00790, partial [Planctomycetes bacterium]|nr:hypothetical protein [Planctomycetota bacterium]